jgi:two-component system chemotaxis sensor kinase CheA
VQTVDNRDYIHYRNQLIPLIYLDRALPSLESVYDKETLCLIIPRSPRPIAIVAATILDTIDIICDLDTTTIHHPGIIGTLFIGSKLTLFIDIFEIIEAIEPGWFSTHLSENKFAKNVLLVEDSTFYLTMLRSYLRGIGANVTSAHNGKEALDLIKRKTFDGVISDIEMPIMNGFEFARALRLQPELQTIPLLAISSKDDSVSREEARNAGFDAFRTKYDMDGMLDLVQKLFKSEKRI